MRYSAGWMSISDDRILEFLSEHESGSPKAMADAGIPRSRSNISQRCSKLVDAGLAKDLGNGVYVITQRGKAYLDERYDVENAVYLDEEGRAVGTTPPEDWSPEDAGSTT